VSSRDRWRAVSASACGAGLSAVTAWQRLIARSGIPSPLLPWLQQTLQFRRHNLRYRGSPDDLFIVSFPRSGTTIMQMLVYQLMTDGRMDFEHMNQISPFFERDVFADLNRRGATIDDLPRPHVFKSHLSYDLMPKGPGRYIYVMRNGLDVAVSFYYQTVRTGFSMSFPEFLDHMIAGRFMRASWFDHVAGWVRNERGLNVLCVSYEDLRDDFAATASTVAAFCEIDVPESAWPRVIERCSFNFMRAHEQKFDDFGDKRRAQIDAEDMHFIRRGRIGQGQELADESRLRAFNAVFDQKLQGLAGVDRLRG
jgi:hypothetical protein